MNIQQEVAKMSDPKRAVSEKKYLKSPMQHYGVSVPLMTKLSKQWVKDNKHLTIDQVIKITNSLWNGVYHEERAVASTILQLRQSDLTFSHLPDLERMMRTAYGWAQIDGIAAFLIGSLYEKYPDKITQVLRLWIKDDNFWVRRTAILTQLVPLREGRGNFQLFSELVTPHLSEKEFFIRKAIGWVLRERAKKVPSDTFAYVRKYHLQMSGLTYREATRRLPPAMQKELKNA